MAKSLGDILIVIVNSDRFLLEKKGMVGSPLADRLEMVRAIRYVDEAIECIDEDQTVAETLRMLKPDIFAKGGDRVPGHMPQKEVDVCRELGIQLVYGVSGKIRHSTGWQWLGGERGFEETIRDRSTSR